MQVIEGELVINIGVYFILPDDWNPTSSNIKTLEDAAHDTISSNEGSRHTVRLYKFVNKPVHGQNNIVIDMRSHYEAEKSSKKTKR